METGIVVSDFERKRDLALDLLDEVARSVGVSHQAINLIPKARQAVDDFYNPLLNRSWTQQAVIAELKKLEATLSAGGASGSGIHIP